MVRPFKVKDIPEVMKLVGCSGLFDEHGSAEVRKSMDSHFQDNDGSMWFVSENEKIDGIVYCIPERLTDRTWNVLMLVVSGDSQGKGIGRELMEYVESELRVRGQRLVVVETSDSADFAGTRSFYGNCGYTASATVPDFYEDGDGKVICWKRISTCDNG